MPILAALVLAVKYASEASALIGFFTKLHQAGTTVLTDAHKVHIQTIAPNIASAFTIEGDVQTFLSGKPA
jgi:hypothetical protein